MLCQSIVNWQSVKFSRIPNAPKTARKTGKNTDYNNNKREPSKRKQKGGGNENRAENNDNADTVPDQRGERKDTEADEKDNWRTHGRGKIAPGEHDVANNPCNVRIQVWSLFQIVRVAVSKQEVEVARCSKCHVLYSVMNDDGTSRMKRHWRQMCPAGI